MKTSNFLNETFFLGAVPEIRPCSICLQPSLVPTPSWACPWPSVRPEQQRRAFLSTATLPTSPDTRTSFFLFLWVGGGALREGGGAMCPHRNRQIFCWKNKTLFSKIVNLLWWNQKIFKQKVVTLQQKTFYIYIDKIKLLLLFSQLNYIFLVKMQLFKIFTQKRNFEDLNL